MNFKQQLIEESKKLKYLDKLCEDIEFIKQEMLLASDAREYVIYLTKKATTNDGVSRYGSVTLRIPNGVKQRVYYEAMMSAIRELGFESNDIERSETDNFYRIQVNW
jgi:hypothetical protein